MAAAGVFKLIANDGKADRMIMASELLQCRINDIVEKNKARGLEDVAPTLVDIERSHILFVNAHFKPFAAIGYEYNKVKPQSGNTQFGGQVQFSIPQFGDFFNDMVVNLTLDAVSAAAAALPAFPTAVPDFFPDTGDLFTSSSVAYAWVDRDGNALTGDQSDHVRYCEFPGMRALRRVAFEVNGNPLDAYTSDTYVFHEKFNVGPHKRAGWNRSVGQEVPLDSYSDLFVSDAGTSEYARRVGKVMRGAQTPKATQPALDMWIPLLFWFNTDVRLSIPSVSIPYGQRFLTIDLARQADLVFTVPGNVYLQTTTTTTTRTVAGTILAGSTNTVDTAPSGAYTAGVSKSVDMTATKTGGALASQGISGIDLYINNIFVNPEIHDIYIARIGFTLIRVNRLQTVNVNTPDADILMSQFKFPTEYIYLGLRPSLNLTDANRAPTDWHRFSWTQSKNADVKVRTLSETVGFDGAANNLLLASSSTHPVEKQTYRVPVRTVDRLTVTAHAIPIYNDFPQPFFSQYAPYTFGGTNMNTPEDDGAMLVNFCLYPGTYQPNGHINISRTREFYIRYFSSIVGTLVDGATLAADLVANAKAINFLLISDGSAVLRYST